MDEWHVDIIKFVVTTLIAGIGGWWAHWSWTRKERTKAEIQRQERQAEYDQFKAKRRLIGAGDVEKMERADRLTDLIIKQKQHQITPDEFKAYRDDLIAGRKQRGKSSDVERSDGRSVKYGHWTVEGFMKLASFDDRLTDEQRRQLATYIMAVLQERGPNGSPVGFLDNGDKVEWLSSDEEEIANGAEDHWPLLLLRNEDEIHAASEEFFEKVWWNRHQIWLEKIADGKDAISEDQKGILETAKAAAKRIEEKYGRENLGWGDFEWGMVNGKLSALRWVTGSEWDFLDT